ncbi:MAG: hypothetical protein H7Y43_08035 [Akkermansiaceae bacterium]|nr:hypothetical protein [Verrucomicrobiales bacterium]
MNSLPQLRPRSCADAIIHPPRRMRLEERQYHTTLSNVLIIGFGAGFVVATLIFVLAWHASK